MFSKTTRQIQPSSCKLVQGKPIYPPSIFRYNKNGRFVENRKKSANICLGLRKGFQATLDPGSLFKLKPSKNYQSMMGFLWNYERSSFLSYFPFSSSISYLNLLQSTSSFPEFYTVETRSLFDVFFRGYIAEEEGYSRYW